MKVLRPTIYLFAFITVLTCAAYLFAVASSAQTSSLTIDPDLRPDTRRALAAQQPSVFTVTRKNGYVSVRQGRLPRPLNPSSPKKLPRVNRDAQIPATTGISAGTPLLGSAPRN